MIRSSLLCGFALLAALAPAAAQGRSDTFWLGAGVGPGWLRVSCPICRSNRGTGVSGYVAIGGSAGRRTLIGAEATGRFRRDGAVRETNWSFSAVTYLYLNPRRRQLFWKVGAGVQLYRLEDGQDVLTASPFGVQVGIGWELPLSRSLRRPTTRRARSWGGGLKFNGSSAPSSQLPCAGRPRLSWCNSCGKASGWTPPSSHWSSAEKASSRCSIPETGATWRCSGSSPPPCRSRYTLGSCATSGIHCARPRARTSASSAIRRTRRTSRR